MTDVVREQFEWLTADDLSRIPSDVEFPVTVCGLARVAPSISPDPAMCERVYDALTPFAGYMNYTGTSISDANDIGLACVADELGRFEVADDHFRAAIDLADRAQALPYALHYRYEWARALVRRGDVGRAVPLLDVVAERAAGRDMFGPDGYVAWAADLRAEIN